MNHKEIMASLNSAIDSVSESISDYVLTPGKDFTRIRKLPANTLMKFLIAEGSSSTKNKLIDFFGTKDQPPSSSAFFQQRVKLQSEALYKVMELFNESVTSTEKTRAYRFIAADGSTATYFSRDKYSPPEIYTTLLQEIP